MGPGGGAHTATRQYVPGPLGVFLYVLPAVALRCPAETAIILKFLGIQARRSHFRLQRCDRQGQVRGKIVEGLKVGIQQGLGGGVRAFLNKSFALRVPLPALSASRESLKKSS